jgi:uncharacterized membrane protein
MVLAIIGITIACYLFLTHSAQTGACSSSCNDILESSYSTLFGIPVSLIGLTGFALLLAIATYGFVTNNKKALKPLFVLSTLSLFFVAYLVYLELAVLHQVCYFCTAAHFLGLTIWGLLLFELAKS